MRYVTRDQWNAQPPKYRNVMPRPVSLAVIHHSVTPPDANPYSTVQGIQRFHMGSKGWSDIAYQELVCMAREWDGWVFEGRGFGFIGGATGSPPGDSHSLSVCLLGNAEETPPSDAALESIAQRLAYAEKIGRLAPGWEIRGDRDYNQTACPGKHLYRRLGEIRQRAAEIVAGNEPTPAPPVEEDDPMAVQWLYYRDGKTEWVVTPDGQARFYGPAAMKALRDAGRIPATPVQIDGAAGDFRAGNK